MYSINHRVHIHIDYEPVMLIASQWSRNIIQRVILSNSWQCSLWARHTNHVLVSITSHDPRNIIQCIVSNISCQFSLWACQSTYVLVTLLRHINTSHLVATSILCTHATTHTLVTHHQYILRHPLNYLASHYIHALWHHWDFKTKNYCWILREMEKLIAKQRVTGLPACNWLACHYLMQHWPWGISSILPS